MIIYKPHTIRLIAYLLFTLTPFFSYAQERNEATYSITSDYNLLIKKIEQQTLKAESSKYDEFKTIIGDVKEHKKIKLALPSPAQKEISPEELYKLRSKGVLMIGSFYDCGKCDRMHSTINATAAVLTEDGICISNHHVFEKIGLGGKKDTSAIKKHMYVADIDGNIFTIKEMLTYSDAGDLAIFKINTNGIKLSPIPLGDDAPIASTVHAITHPKGKELYYYSRGIVARNVTDSKDPFKDRINVSCEYSVGSSGGPIFDNKGNLIGVVSTTRSLYSDKQPSHLQMVLRGIIPVKTIKRLL